MFEDSAEVVNLLERIAEKLETLESIDRSIDFLASAMTGADPLEIDVGQAALGRLQHVPKASKMDIKESAIEKIIEEEITKVLEWDKEEVRRIINAPRPREGGSWAQQMVAKNPDKAAKMLEDLLNGVTLVGQEVDKVKGMFKQLNPGERNRATHGLQEVKRIVEKLTLKVQLLK